MKLTYEHDCGGRKILTLQEDQTLYQFWANYTHCWLYVGFLTFRATCHECGTDYRHVDEEHPKSMFYKVDLDWEYIYRQPRSAVVRTMLQ